MSGTPRHAAADPDATTIDALTATVAPASLGDYLRGWLARVRGGDAGVLPVVVALAVVFVVFQVVSPRHVFLSPGNLVNLFIQSCVFIVLAMGEGFALLIGEIDLSIGYVAAIGGILAANLVQPVWSWPWWGAIVVALVATAAIGLLQGAIVTRLGLPSFVVTLAGYLIWFGVMIIILGPSGGVSISSQILVNERVLFQIMQGTIPPAVSWVALGVAVLGFGWLTWSRDAGRRRSGLVAPPTSLTLVKIGAAGAAGAVVVAICNINRGVVLPVMGVPWVLPIVLGLLAFWTILLEWTRFGRYVYAVGGNAEAALRAGINVRGVRTLAFVLCSMTAGMAGILYASWQGGMNTNISGGQLVLYAVAAAVIGGTSLFGGRGRAIHGVLGGLVIGAINNGLYLLGLEVQWQFIATGLVLLAAVTVDALSRRGSAAVR
jgi:D-xylose transport system permease protein